MTGEVAVVAGEVVVTVNVQPQPGARFAVTGHSAGRSGFVVLDLGGVHLYAPGVDVLDDLAALVEEARGVLARLRALPESPRP